MSDITLNGRVKPVPGVSEAKIAKVKELMERHNAGDLVASATLQEALTSSDAVFNLAHLATLNFIPNYDEAERTWRQVADVRTTPDLRPVTLYSLSRQWTNDPDGSESGVIGEHNEAPVVPEGAAYPYAYISGEVAQGASVVKRGFKTDWTLEARINDGLNSLDRLPEEMLNVALDTEQADVYGALVTQVAAYGNSGLAGGVIPGDTTVVANAPFSRDAVIRAVIELSERVVDGRKIGTVNGFNLIVPTGQAVFVNFWLNQTLNRIETGSEPSFVYQVNGYNPLAGISVVESDFLTGQEWYLLPKPGATRRPVLERLQLRGYETPQLFVDNHVGQFVGGGSVSPFEGSFASDVITLKLRQFGGGVVWDAGMGVVYSSGTGSEPPSS